MQVDGKDQALLEAGGHESPGHGGRSDDDGIPLPGLRRLAQWPHRMGPAATSRADDRERITVVTIDGEWSFVGPGFVTVLPLRPGRFGPWGSRPLGWWDRFVEWIRGLFA